MEGSFSILIVDDAKENVEILVHFLRSENFNVLKSYSADEARRILLSTEVDLILLDVNMPVQDGYSFCKELREIERFKLLPILFITAVDRESGFQEAIRNGGDDFISKPFSKKELLAKIHAFRRIKGLQDQLIAEKSKYERELRAARKVQEQLIPPKIIEWNGIIAATFFRPLFQIGGDFVDIWIEDNKLHTVIADCSGHGPSAALVAVVFKMQLMHTRNSPNLISKVEELRKNLNGLLPEDYFITFVYLMIDRERNIEYIKCAHPEPFVHSRGKIITLPGNSPMISDIKTNVSDNICYTKLEKDTTILLYTDGLVEVINPKLEMLGEDGLKSIFLSVVEEDPPIIFEKIVQEVKKFCANQPPEDDIAMICIKL